MAKVLIAGCGYVGSALGLRLVRSGDRVYGLRRRTEALPPALLPLRADLSEPRSLGALPPALDYVVYAAAADETADEAYRTAYVHGPLNLLSALDEQGQRPRRVAFTSSTAVYAQQGGAWVDEESPAQATHFTGRRVLQGERLWLDGPFAAVVLRLGGIYGPGRSGLIESVRSGRARPAPRGIYTNRIHRDDAAGALAHLLSLDRVQPLYLGVDHEPAEQREVLRWLAVRLGVPEPAGEGPADPISRRQRTNKRCRNGRLVGSGYVFRYPTFREGYAELLGTSARAQG